MSQYPPPPPPPPPPPGGFTPSPPPPPPGGGFGPPPGGGFVPPPPPGGPGYVPPPPPGGYMPGGYSYAAPRTDGLAIASLIIGIVSLLCSFMCLGVVLGPTAAIMGFISRQRVSTSGGAIGGGTMALIGLILGVVGFVLSALAVFFWFSGGFGSFPSSSPSP